MAASFLLHRKFLLYIFMMKIVHKKGGCQVEGLPGIDYEKVFIYFKHTLYPLFMISVYVGEMDKQCYVNENSLNEK